jgi:hypothetical protein
MTARRFAVPSVTFTFSVKLGRAGISVAIIAVVSGLGTKLKTTFSSISSQLK